MIETSRPASLHRGADERCAERLLRSRRVGHRDRDDDAGRRRVEAKVDTDREFRERRRRDRVRRDRLRVLADADVVDREVVRERARNDEARSAEDELRLRLENRSRVREDDRRAEADDEFADLRRGRVHDVRESRVRVRRRCRVSVGAVTHRGSRPTRVSRNPATMTASAAVTGVTHRACAWGCHHGAAGSRANDGGAGLNANELRAPTHAVVTAGSRAVTDSIEMCEIHDAACLLFSDVRGHDGRERQKFPGKL